MSTLGPPPASVRVDLTKNGFTAKDVDGVELWTNGATTGTWTDALHVLCEAAFRARQIDALSTPAWYKSTKFWALVGLGFGVAGTGFTMLGGWLAPGHPELGAMLMTAGGALGAAYAWLRVDENRKVLAEKVKILTAPDPEKPEG